jgi:outer membrane protein assembly factor BamB
MRRHLIALWVAAAAIGSPSAVADLTTYGYSNARLGTSPPSSAIAPARAPRLRVAWRANVGGAVNAQPLVVDRVRIGGARRDLLIVATEHGAVVALDARTGERVWQRHLASKRMAPDCDASPDGIFGVTGTPVVDRRARRVYVVDVDGRAWALSLSNGRVARGWPQRVHARGAEFVWGALSVSRGWLYVPIASLCDAGRYQGGVDAISLAHPGIVRRWQTTAGTDAYGGGIWGWGGVSIDDLTGDVFAASGNSLGTRDEATPHAESVIRLSAGLAFREANDPLLGPFQSSDRDFGTTPVLIDARGCPPLAVAINKDGELFTYDRHRIRDGPLTRVRVAADSATGVPLYGMPAWDPATHTLVLTSPSAPAGSGLIAGIRAYSMTAACSFSPRWQRAFGYPDAGSPPTIAGGVVYLGSGRDGWLRSYRLRDGRPLWAKRLSRGAIFAAPTVDRGTLFDAGWDGRVWAVRPRR